MYSYPHIYALSHGAIKELLGGEAILIQEKLDGSQLSFGILDGELKFRSKSRTFTAETADDMFNRAVEVVLAAPLKPGLVYRGEYLKKPKHNVLAYDRIPQNHIAIFDINPAQEQYLPYYEVQREANRLGFEVAKAYYEGPGNTLGLGYLGELLENVSQLGGQKVEGVVLKNYARFGKDGHALMGKHVSEAFKEVHAGEWRKENPTKSDILEQLVAKYRTPARWNKAIQHLRDDGRLLGEPKDIGNLFKEVQVDVEKECEEEIKDFLWDWARKHVVRGVTRGLPEFYKELLAEKQFAKVDND